MVWINLPSEYDANLKVDGRVLEILLLMQGYPMFIRVTPYCRHVSLIIQSNHYLMFHVWRSRILASQNQWQLKEGIQHIILASLFLIYLLYDGTVNWRIKTARIISETSARSLSVWKDGCWLWATIAGISKNKSDLGKLSKGGTIMGWT
jgi:hypothetical protein